MVLLSGLFGILLLSHAVVGQSQAELKPKGWHVPDIKQLTVDHQSIELLNGVFVTKRTYKLGNSKLNTRTNTRTYCEFTTLNSYHLENGKMFAIGGECVVFSLAVTRSKNITVSSKNYAGAITHFTFYDRNGDGKFEARYNSSYSSDQDVQP